MESRSQEQEQRKRASAKDRDHRNIPNPNPPWLAFGASDAGCLGGVGFIQKNEDDRPLGCARNSMFKKKEIAKNWISGTTLP
jgi:hypothetical protein